MSELTQLLIASLLKQRMAEPALEREREERAAELAEQREANVAARMAEILPAAKFKATRPIFKHMKPEMFDAYTALSAGNDMVKKEQEQLAQLMNPQQLAQLGARAAPTLGSTGRLVPPDPNTSTVGTDIAQRTVGLNAAGRPDLIQLLMSQVGGAREATEITNRETLAGERRQVGITAEGEGRADYRGRRNAAVEAEANALAYSRSGIAKLDESPEAVAQRLIQGGINPATAKSEAARAIQLSRGIEPTILEARTSAQGKTEAVQRAEDRKAQLLEEYPQLANDPALDRRAREIEAGQVVLDPYHRSVNDAPVFIPTQGEAAHKRMVARREALIDVGDNLQLLDDSYNAAVAARNDPARRGEFTGGPLQTDSFFDTLALFGAGPPEVLSVRTAAVRYAFAEARSTQGAKSSDMDFAKNMLYVPAPNEIGTPLGEQKMRQLKQIFEASVDAPISPKIREATAKINAKYRSATAGLNAVAAQAAKEIEDTGAISTLTQKRLDTETAKFQRSPAARKMRRDLEDAGIVTEGGGAGPTDAADFGKDF